MSDQSHGVLFFSCKSMKEAPSEVHTAVVVSCPNCGAGFDLLLISSTSGTVMHERGRVTLACGFAATIKQDFSQEQVSACQYICVQMDGTDADSAVVAKQTPTN